MKLEKKHLYPYLQYELKMYYETLKGEPREWTLREGALTSVVQNQNKPIFHPLSDLTKEIEHNGEQFVPTNELAIHLFDDITASVILEGNTDGIPYWVMQKLFEWHFDVSGLIPEGLAIDINTL